MRKMFGFFTVLLVMALLPISLFGITAGAATEGYYTYTVSNGKATITNVSTSISGNIVIPSTLGGAPVTSIGDCAFVDCTDLTGITIPNSVTSIGNWAFFCCTGLTSITIPNSVTSIGDEAFSECTRLTSITIPNSVTSIGEGAFYSCIRLTSITIPDSVTSIGDSAFDACTGLTSITIPNSVTSIGDYAFFHCTGLTSITIPDSVTSIGDDAFRGCTRLTSITIPNSVTSIGEGAFFGCTGLTSITIPNSVTSIGDEAFSGCTRLTEITVDSNNQAYTSEDGVLFNKDKTKIVCCPGRKFGAYTIPDSVTSIGDYAFSGCTGLTSITIPDSVTSIGNYAFEDCTGLTGITIPDSVTSIGSSAFKNCTVLTGITIPDSVTSIGDSAFSGCTKLVSITLPFVGQNADGTGFSHFGYIFDFDEGLLAESYQYQTNRYVVPSSLRVVTITGSNSIAKNAFRYCTGLTSITIPDSVTSIGSNAFAGCTGLTSITLPFVGQNADGTGFSHFGYIFGAEDASYPHFYNAEYVPSSLRNVIITGSNSIAGEAFYGCKSLQSVSLAGNVKVLGEHVFYGCSGLRNVTLPVSCVKIGSMNFYDCVNLENVYFLGAESQKKIEISHGNDMLTNIAQWHYNSCYGASEHSYGNGVKCTVCGNLSCQLGDADGDGEITAKDALMALQHTVKLIAMDESQFAAADTDGNGVVDAKDALFVLQYVVKLIDSFPAKVQ